MKRCTYCFRYSISEHPFCSRCGRSFDVRLCSRGHISPRGADFCGECGSGELSTPAPPATFLFHVSQWALRVTIAFTVIIIALLAVLALIYTLDWSAIAPRLLWLVLTVAFLYWTTTLLPGPIRKVGKFALHKGLSRRKRH